MEIDTTGMDPMTANQAEMFGLMVSQMPTEAVVMLRDLLTAEVEARSDG